MIIEHTGQPKENEMEAWTVATGNMPMPWDKRKVKKAAFKALEYIITLDGFIGFFPEPPKGTLCLFDTLNNAKMAKNMMDYKGITTGEHICGCYIDKSYYEKAQELKEKKASGK